MKIALLGMPGSGKTALAEAVSQALADTTVAIIDGYAEEVEDNIDYVKGLDGGGYIYNLAVALERIAWERTAEADHTITCGTILDTSVYTSMDFEMSQEFTDEAEKIDSIRRVEATLKVLACLYMDTFKYDAVFYLTPDEVPEDRRWQLFDRYLQTSFAAFFLVPVVPLTVEDTAKRTEILLSVIKGESTVEGLIERAGTQTQTSDRS